MDVIGAGLQIIEMIELLRGVYNRVKGLGKEVEDAMADCNSMQGDVEALKKLFNKQTPTKFPQQVAIIVQEFKSLLKSTKKLRKLFKEYEKISQKLFGKFTWAYSKPRATILEMREDFASYRGIFQKALLILNEGHNQDQAKALKELKDQADRARKDMNTRIKDLDKKADERSKRDREIYLKKIDELVKNNQATEENRSKVLEKWLVEAKGANKEDAKSCASTALKEGRVPSLKTQNKPDSKKVEKVKKPPEENGKLDESNLTEKAKRVENSGAAAKKPAIKEGNNVQNGNSKPEQKSEPKKDKAPNFIYAPKAKTAEEKKKAEKPEKLVNFPAKKVYSEPPKVEKDKGKSPEVKKSQNNLPKAEEFKSPKPAPKKVFPILEPEKKTLKLDSKSTPSPRKPKVPVIVIQGTDTKGSSKDKEKRRSPSPPSTSWSSSSSNITVVGREKPRAASVSSESSAKSQKERIEKNVRYVKGGDRRARSQEPPQNLAVFFE